MLSNLGNVGATMPNATPSFAATKAVGARDSYAELQAANATKAVDATADALKLGTPAAPLGAASKLDVQG